MSSGQAQHLGPASSAETPDYSLDAGTDDGWEVVDIEDVVHHDPPSPRPAFVWRWEFALSIDGGRSTADLNGSEKHSSNTPTATRDNPTSQQAQCILFSLPPELRLRIYKEVLSIQSPKVQLKWTLAANSRNQHRRSVLAILETCRRIYAETETIFYATNHFEFNDHGVAEGFLRTISPERRGAIKSVSISIASGSEALVMIQAITAASGLQRLRIERRQSIRYTDLGAWVLLAKQIGMELAKLSRLRDLEIVTPEVKTATAEEEERMRRLDQIDVSLKKLVLWK